MSWLNLFFPFAIDGLGPDWEYFKLNGLMDCKLEPHGERLFELIVLVSPPISSLLIASQAD
jgi:hypothetical protein